MKVNAVPNSSKWIVIGLSALLLTSLIRMHGSAEPSPLAGGRSEEWAGSLRDVMRVTAGRLVDIETPAESDPGDQLDFWKYPIEAILAEHPEDAELHAGAAVLLDTPTNGYLSRHLEQMTSDAKVIGWEHSSRIQGMMKSSRMDFDQHAAQDVPRYAAQATRIQPGHVPWWRLRAVLLWPSSMSTEPYDKARVEDWSSILDQAKQQDPGNGLYDVLRISFLANSAIAFDQQAAMVVGDRDAWKAIVQSARSIQSASELTFGEPALNGVVRLHELAGHPVATTTESIRHRVIGARLASEVALAARALLRMATVKPMPEGSPTDEECVQLALAITRLALNHSDVGTQHEPIVFQLHLMALDSLATLSSNDPQRWAALNKEKGETQNRLSHISNVASVLKVKPALHWSSMVGPLALQAMAAFLAATSVFFFAWVVLDRRLETWRFRWFDLFVLAAGMAVSIFYFGAGAAGFVSSAAQNWVSTVIAVVGIAVVSAVGWYRYRGRVQFSIGHLMIACGLVAVVAAWVSQSQVGWSSLGFPLKIHASTPLIAKAVSVGSTMQMTGSVKTMPLLNQVMIVWWSKGGPTMAVGLSMLLWISVRAVQYPFRDGFGSMAFLMLALSLTCGIVWAMMEPTRYGANRPQQLRLQTYVGSLDEYYRPYLPKAIHQEQPLPWPN